MHSVQILYPVFVMVILTFLVGILLFTLNVKAVKQRKVRVKFFKVYNEDAPDYLLQARDHYKNLFEVPVLFYVLCAIIFIRQDVLIPDIVLAWAFVFFRLIHSYIRATSNRLPLRSQIFIISYGVLFVHWIYFITKVMIS
jgi:hypothetical protein